MRERGIYTSEIYTIGYFKNMASIFFLCKELKNILHNIVFCKFIRDIFFSPLRSTIFSQKEILWCTRRKQLCSLAQKKYIYHLSWYIYFPPLWCVDELDALCSWVSQRQPIPSLAPVLSFLSIIILRFHGHCHTLNTALDRHAIKNHRLTLHTGRVSCWN